MFRDLNVPRLKVLCTSLIHSSTLFTGGRYVLAGTNNSDDGSGVTKKVKKLYIHPMFSVGPYWLNAENYGIKQVS